MSDLEKLITNAANNLEWPKSKSEQVLDDIAAELVMVASDDLPGLAKIHDQIELLVSILNDEDQIAAQVARKCGDHIERIVLREVDDSDDALKIIADGITALQGIVRDKRGIKEVVIPEILRPDDMAAADEEIDEHAAEILDSVTSELVEATEISAESASKKKKGKSKAKKEPKAKKDSKAKKESKGKKEAKGKGKPKSGTKVTEIEEPKVTKSKAKEKVTDDSVKKEWKELKIALTDFDESLLTDFITEAREHCSAAEESLMNLESNPGNTDDIDAIFRGFHTIKGAAGFLELEPISVLAHESETLLDMGRKGTVTLKGVIADSIFESIDMMRELLEALDNVLKTGEVYYATEKVMPLVEKLQRIIANPEAAEEEAGDPKLGEVLVDMGAVSEDDVNTALGDKKDNEKIGESLVREGKTNVKAVDHALKDQQRIRSEKGAKEIVKIDTERLDRLVDTIGELVIAESMVGQDEEILSKASTKMAKNISHLNKITRELQEMGMAMRLVTVKSAFQKLSRAVRDLTRRSGKDIQLELIGEDSEVDRSIVENIGDPLMHMIRNSVDHGIETPSERVRAGKSAQGKIWVRAFHKGGNIYFEIEDDGRGLDRDRILSKAIDKGLAVPGKDYSDKEIFGFILQPGFSTARKITEISGRGVGMDVVKKNIDAMRGHLEIESTLGKGTKFSMKLPLTLAIIDGMLVSVGTERFILPTLSVVESLQMSNENITRVKDRFEMINLRGNMLPLFRIRNMLDLEASNNEDTDSTIVIIDDMERQVGLVIDKLLGQRQTVIKSLGIMFKDQKWISGGAILSDGSIGLIIDVGGIINLANEVDCYSMSSLAPKTIEEAILESEPVENDSPVDEADDVEVENTNEENLELTQA